MIADAAPLLWLLVGPNGAGKSTYYARRIHPILDAPLVNADLIARGRWPDAPAEHAWDALREADAVRAALTFRSPDLPRAIATLFDDAITGD